VKEGEALSVVASVVDDCATGLDPTPLSGSTHSISVAPPPSASVESVASSSSTASILSCGWELELELELEATLLLLLLESDEAALRKGETPVDEEEDDGAVSESGAGTTASLAAGARPYEAARTLPGDLISFDRTAARNHWCRSSSDAGIRLVGSF